MKVPLCKSCKHLEVKGIERCFIPMGINLVNGEKSFWLALDHRRGVGNRCCGQRGNFFEPIDPANIQYWESPSEPTDSPF